MSAIRIKTRSLASVCAVCKSRTHFQVVYRLGGRGFPELVGGTFHYRREASTRRDFVAGEIAAGRDPAVALARMAGAGPDRRVAQWEQPYLASRVDLRKPTLESHRQVLRHVRGRFGSLTPAGVTFDLVQAWIGELAGDDYEFGPGTIRRYVGVLRQLLDFTGVEPNGARDKRVKLPRVDAEEIAPPPAEHVLLMLEQLSPKTHRLPFAIVEQTGMRRAEIAALRWGDVDHAGLRFRLRGAVTKSGRPRWPQVPEWLMELIDASCPFDDRTPDRPVFIGFSPGALQKAMERACKKAGITHYHPHDLRHRRVSLWHGQGIPWKEIAERVGHARASMTIDVYSHVMPLEEVAVDRYKQAIAA